MSDGLVDTVSILILNKHVDTLSVGLSTDLFSSLDSDALDHTSLLLISHVKDSVSVRSCISLNQRSEPESSLHSILTEIPNLFENINEHRASLLLELVVDLLCFVLSEIILTDVQIFDVSLWNCILDVDSKSFLPLVFIQKLINFILAKQFSFGELLHIGLVFVKALDNKMSEL